jgi:hypothetical protein
LKEGTRVLLLTIDAKIPSLRSFVGRSPSEVGSLSPQHGASSGCGWRNGLQLWRLAANILNKQSWTDNKEWSSSLGVGRRATNLHHKNKLVTKNLTEPRTWTDSLDKRLKQRNMDMRFGMWNVRSLYRAGSLLTQV